MANYEAHYLYAKNLKSDLLKAGVLEEISEPCRAKELGYTHKLFFEKCNAEEWEKDLAAILERGVINFALQREDGGYGVRRDYTPKEVEDLAWWPVIIQADGETMYWESKWVSSDFPCFYASLALPKQTLILTEFYEGRFDFGGYLKNGQLLAEKPCIKNGAPWHLLWRASSALRKLNLTEEAAEMRQRFKAVKREKNGKSVKDQRISVIVDYVCLQSWLDHHDEDDAFVEAAMSEENKPVHCEHSFPDSDLPF